MARYQLTLAYDGTDFFGSQRQVNRRTVQGELEVALCRLGWSGHSILMSGRTDTGVHASGQVASVDLSWPHSDDELLRALNALLPPDLAVHRARVVSAEFHPRFDAHYRRYRYRLFYQPVQQPLRERFAWRIRHPLPPERLHETAKLFPGTHDFSSFGSPTAPGGTTVRTVISAEWSQGREDEWQFDVQANAFLYRMVRRLVFVQVAVAQGKVSLETVAAHVAGLQAAGAMSEKLPAGLAPARGLTLVEVAYSGNESKGQ